MWTLTVRRLGVSIATLGNVRDQPKVADAASELLQDVFGKSAKAKSKNIQCPLVSRIELETIFEVKA